MWKKKSTQGYYLGERKEKYTGKKIKNMDDQKMHRSSELWQQESSAVAHLEGRAAGQHHVARHPQRPHVARPAVRRPRPVVAAPQHLRRNVVRRAAAPLEGVRPGQGAMGDANSHLWHPKGSVMRHGSTAGQPATGTQKKPISVSLSPALTLGGGKGYAQRSCQQKCTEN